MWDNFSSLVDRFSDVLGSSQPVPGGGGAAAMCGCLAASLGCMAGNIRREKLPYGGEKHFIIVERLIPLEKLRKRFLRLMDDDAAAFLPLAETYTKSSQMEGHAQRLYRCSLAAAKPPLEMMESCLELLKALKELQPLVGKLLQSDIGCAAYLCASAMECAAVNVFVNTASYRDREEADEMHRRAEAILAAGPQEARAFAQEVLAFLRGEENHG